MADILFVEDEEWLADCYQRWVSPEYSSRVVGSAQAAIYDVDDYLPKAIVLDMFLPVANGIQLLHELKSHPDLAGIPVILCSGANLSDLAEDLMGYGVARILDKTTLTRAKLREAVAEVVK